MKKQLRSITHLALVCGLVLGGFTASAQTANSANLLLPVDEIPANPSGTSEGNGQGPFDSDRFFIFPNPVVGRIMNFSVPASGQMVLSLYALSGPSAGNGIPLVYDSAYPGRTRKTVVLPSYFYPGTWLLIGRVGNSFYKERIIIAN